MTATQSALDVLRPFQLETSQLRGRSLRLGPTIDAVLKAHDYPEPVSRLLGELLVLAGAFAGALKFEGTFSLQVRGDGPLRLMVADITNDGRMRGYAGFDERSDLLKGGDGAGDETPALRERLGKAVMAVTVDQRPSGGETYQGIVPLEGDTLTQGMLTYFHQSEQVPTGICSAVAQDEASGEWSGGAVVLQAMPGEGATTAKEREEDWRRAMMLLQTVTDEEMLNPGLPLDTLLFRLFHEEGVRVFDKRDLSFGCSCSEERVRDMFLRFSPDEILEMREDDGETPGGSINVTCQFCSRRYSFGEKGVAELIEAARRNQPNPSTH